jgi:glucokinase
MAGVAFSPVASSAHFLGVDLGGSSIKAVVVNSQGGLLSSANVPFVDRDMEWAHKVRSLVAQFRTDFGAPAGIGLSAPGLAARDERRIAHLPGRLTGLEGLDWTDYLSAERSVPVLNDAHAALLGEVWLGAAQGLNDVFMLTLGTGVGGAAWVDGHLLKGHIGRAGHLGHISLNFDGPLDDVLTPGSLEHEIGNKNIRARSDGRFPTTHALVTAHLAGDAAATEIWGRSIRALAAGIASLVNVLDPEAVIIGGGIARAGRALFDPLQQHLDRFEWRPGKAQVRLIEARLGDLAGAYGSAWNALRSAETRS